MYLNKTGNRKANTIFSKHYRSWWKLGHNQRLFLSIYYILYDWMNLWDLNQILEFTKIDVIAEDTSAVKVEEKSPSSHPQPTRSLPNKDFHTFLSQIPNLPILAVCDKRHVKAFTLWTSVPHLNNAENN